MHYFRLQEEEEEESRALTYRQRIAGFITCFLVGLLLNVLGYVVLVIGLHKTRYAVITSLGNLVSLSGTAFLVGPQRQWANMKDPSRRYTSLAFLVALVATLYSALYLQNAPLAVLCSICQYTCYIWYSLSYVPFGRSLCKRCLWCMV